MTWQDGTARRTDGRTYDRVPDTQDRRSGSNANWKIFAAVVAAVGMAVMLTDTQPFSDDGVTNGAPAAPGEPHATSAIKQDPSQ